MTARSVSTNLLLLFGLLFARWHRLQLSLLLVDSYPLQHRSNYTTCMTIDSFSVDPFASHLASVWEVKLPVGTSGIRGRNESGRGRRRCWEDQGKATKVARSRSALLYFFVLSMPPFAFLHFLSFISRCPLIWFPQKGRTATPCRDVGSPWNLFNLTFNNFFLVAIPSVWMGKLGMSPDCRQRQGRIPLSCLWVRFTWMANDSLLSSEWFLLALSLVQTLSHTCCTGRWFTLGQWHY